MAALERKSTARANTRNARDRKRDIIDALYRCMAEKGYAASTLSDVAAEAEMSSSHLLYYFPGKEAILEEFFRDVCARAKGQLEALPDEPIARLDGIADVFLGPRKADRTERAVMLDLYGQTVQNRVMRKAKIAHDRYVKKELVKVFKQVPRTAGTSAEDAAQSAYAMLMGLRATSFYDSSLTAAETHRLFRQTLYRLAGLRATKSKRRKSA